MENLLENFKNPPPDCGIFVRWWWFGPAVEKEELKRELRIMHEAGVCGVEIQPVYPLSLNNPERGIKNVRFLSIEFLDAVRFVIKEAKALGMTVDVTLGSGWPFGGPHIPLHLSAKRMRVASVEVSSRCGSSEPVAIKRPLLAIGEKLVKVLAIKREDGKLNPQSTVDLTEKFIEDVESVEVDFPGGEWEVLFFIEGYTLQEVKRAALGAEGYVLDHLSREALEKHLETVGESLIFAGEGGLRAVFCDSLEVFESNWTGDFLSKFREKWGYDLADYLPCLWREFGWETPLIRIDYGRTLSEIAIEEFIKPLKEWCSQKNVKLRMQMYGVPPIDPSGYKYVDLPEGEGRDWRNISPSRWASSAAHQYGKDIVSAEAFTFLSRIPSAPFPGVRFTVSLCDLKAAADLYFLQGINHLIAHGYGYSPPIAGVPGWTLYASCLINHNNTWWRYFPLFASYVRRVSYVLRLGEPIIDVALYLPIHDSWAKTDNPSRFRTPMSIKVNPDIMDCLLRCGYNFDFIGDDALLNSRVEDGKIIVNGMRYSILILPEVSYLPFEVMRKISEIAALGGVVLAIGHPPKYPCGLLDFKHKKDEFQHLVRDVFDGRLKTARVVKDEHELKDALLETLTPDLRFLPEDGEIGFVHRRFGDLDFYFISNTSGDIKKVKAYFRVSNKTPEIWDPMSGEKREIYVYLNKEGITTVPITLQPFSSLIIVFKPPLTESIIYETDLPEILSVRQEKERYFVRARVEVGGRYVIFGKMGRIEVEAEDPPHPIIVSGPWKVSFKTEEGVKEIEMRSLVSWTQLENFKYYSGSATYYTEVEVPKDYFKDDITLQLDLGEVKEIAEVKVNGKCAGVTWIQPHILNVTGLLQPGLNRLEISVTNLLINKVLGQGKPDYSMLFKCYGQRFPEPIEDERMVSPFPSGLLGPVIIKPLKTLIFKF